MKDETELRDLTEESIPPEACIQIASLLEEGIRLEEEIKRTQEKLEETKATLLNWANEYDVAGFKANGLAFTKSWIEGRNTLSRELLLSHGVLPSVIEKSYAKSSGYWMRKLFRMKEKMAKPRVV